MNYVVIDTNVIVSALLAINPTASNPFSIIKAAFMGRVKPVLSEAIMKEYREVLTRKKFGFNEEKIDIFLSELKSQSVFINPPRLKVVLPDAKDQCFYEAAMVYENVGGLLVTGNIKHFPGCGFAVTPVQLKEKMLLSK